MKKWIIVVAILICLGLYAIVKFSISQDQDISNQVEQSQTTKQISNSNNVDNADKPAPAEDSEPAVPAAKVEAVNKAMTEFQSCLKDGKYEKAWEFTSEYFKQRVCEGGFEGFKEICDRIGLATATVHPKSAVVIDDRVGLLVSSPSFKEDLYFFFVEEDGQWKLYRGQEARDVSQ